jgi:hypothetical protein
VCPFALTPSGFGSATTAASAQNAHHLGESTPTRAIPSTVAVQILLTTLVGKTAARLGRQRFYEPLVVAGSTHQPVLSHDENADEGGSGVEASEL